MEITKEHWLPRILMARTIFAWILLMLVYFMTTNSLVHQWEQPVLIYPGADNTYWLLHLLDIPQMILSSASAGLIFDLVLSASVILFLVFPRKSIFCLVAVTGLWLYQVMYGSVNGHHYHHAGMMIVPLPFLFVSQMRFFYTWSVIRYWVLFLFVTSALYKFYYGGFFHEENMAAILQQHFAPSASFRNNAILYLIDHPVLAQAIYQLATLLQLFCITGFFTRKLDNWILGAFLLFNISNYLLLNIPFWDNSLLIAPFLPWKTLAERISRRSHSETAATFPGSTERA